MMLSRTRHVAAALLSLVVASACGSDSATSSLDTPSTGGTLADAVAQLSTPALGASASLSGIPPITRLDPSRCAYSAATQSFACPAVVVSGLTATQSYTLLDASGGKQSAYGATTTAAVRTNSSITGTVTTFPTSYTVDSQQELTLSGLLTGKHTLDGTSTTKLTATGANLTTPFVNVVTSTIDKLVLPADATGPSAWPTSGTITAESKSIANDQPTTLLTVKITFTGSSSATVAVTTSGFSQTCTVDLSSHAPSCS